MCWFYSIPNLLVIQQLDTLYLDENYVRVMRECEEIQLCEHSRDFSQLDLATDLRLATRQNATHVKHAGS